MLMISFTGWAASLWLVISRNSPRKLKKRLRSKQLRVLRRKRSLSSTSLTVSNLDHFPSIFRKNLKITIIYHFLTLNTDPPSESQNFSPKE
jgi:hypothetical protein